jgi:hypothetical protein
MDPYIAKLIGRMRQNAAEHAKPQDDPRSLPFYCCNAKGRRLLLIKQKLNEEQMGLLRLNMNSIRIWLIEQQMSPEERAEIQRTVDAAMASRRTGGAS